MGLVDKLKDPRRRRPEKRGPVWKGPEEDGITFSLLSRFLTCRERFRLLVVEGLKAQEGFNHRIEYGNMWHVCEEALARCHNAGDTQMVPERVCAYALTQYAQSLCRKYPLAQEQIDKWYNVCRVQFPLYVKYRSEHPDVTERTPLLQEQTFDVPYRLPSGRTVRLRGKWDSVDLVGKGKSAGIYLQENKTKGDIDPVQMQRQLTFDLQTMMYMVALGTPQKEWHSAAGRDVKGWPYGAEIRGVRYNVVRRPLSGGKGTIVQHKPTKSNPQGESKDEYYARLRGIIGGSPDEFFMRWKVEITPGDVTLFRQRCLDPVLEQLCDWWQWITCVIERSHIRNQEVWDNDVTFGCDPPYDHKQGDLGLHPSAIHWQHPFGVRNVLDEGGHTDLDEYIRSGSEVGLTRTDNLFPEL
jgi:hypothetical protein